MSLHALAGHMAAKGRGPDSMLVHMTPDEVQSLQTMARAQGGEVTINPETGLPEAGFLSDTLKALAPMALGAVLGPAGFGLSATMAGVATGGITALATGSLSRGLMAGMGAYGGAGLAEGLANMGSSAIGADALAAANADPNAIASLTAAKDAATAAGTAAPSGLSAVSEGAKRAFTSAEGFKELGNTMGGMGKLATTGLAAISPIMADQGVQTTTPKQDTGYIRQKKFNPYTQQYIDLEPVKASEWGNRNFSDFAGGGVVALAAGGVSDTDIQGWMAANQGADDKTIAAAMQQYGVTPGQLSSAMGYNPAEVQQRYEYAIAPQIVSQYSEGVAGPGGTTAQQGSGYLGIYDQLTKAGISPEELYNAPGYQGWSQPAISRAYDVAAGINAFDPRTDVGSPSDKEWAAFMDTNKFGVRDIAQATGLSEAEVQRRYDAAKFVKPVPVVQPSIATEANLPGGVSGGGNTVVNPNGTITTAPNIPGRPAGGFTGMGQVKDVYTQGGGSLGQTNLFVPKTIDEMYARYGTTGGSKQAYDYLMGKGSADIKKPVTQSGELMLPYGQAVLGQEVAAATGTPTQKYLFDPKTRRYINNPAYVDPNAPKEEAPKEPAVTNTAMATEAANGGMMRMALGGLGALAAGGATSQYNLGGYSDGGRLLRGPGDGVSDSIPATIGDKQPARLADGEFVVPARIVSELGNGSTEAGARKLYAMMDRVQKARGKTTGKNRVAANTRSDKYLPA